ncbi:hypothetical protein CHI02_23260 [Niallia circulans]|uniref:hypothetical protein n=1 Tax=Niallia circulans TaxID=1397 RepID=UPI000BA4E6D7|nr:hypothetical protein [Niallia circulans]PAE09784.1 hypothetical protein CHI02_23260 [Niallia circulans]
MNLILTRAETEVLIVHLHVMRKNIKTVLKRNYGNGEGKRLLKVYDKVKDELKDKLKFLEAEKGFPFVFNREEIDLIYSFLQIFFQKIELEMKNKISIQSEREKVKNNLKMDYLVQVREKINLIYIQLKVGELNGI